MPRPALPCVALLAAALAACARDEGAEAAKAARDYCAALAAGRWHLAWCTTTREARNWYEEVADGFRHPEVFAAWRFGADWRTLWPHLATADAARITAEETFARDKLKCGDRGLLRACEGETPVVEIDGDTAQAFWPRSGLCGLLVWQRGAWRVDCLLPGPFGSHPSRMTVSGPFGRPIAEWDSLTIREPAGHVRLPRLWGPGQDGSLTTMHLYADTAGGRWVEYSRISDEKALTERLWHEAERGRDDHDRLMNSSTVEAVLHADRKLPWREAFRLLLALTDPAVRFRRVFAATLPEVLPGFGTTPRDWRWMGIPFDLQPVLLLVKVLLFDARVELTVTRGDVAAGLLDRVPAVFAAVPADMKEHGVRLVLDDDLPWEDALRTILAVASVRPERIVLGARAEVGTAKSREWKPPLELALATAPVAAPPPRAPLTWPIRLTIHWGERPDWAGPR